LRSGESTLGGFGQVYFQPNDLMAFGQFSYGVTDTFQAEARLCLGSLDPYFGIFGKYGMIRRKSIDLSLFFGYHHFSLSFADLGLILGHTFKSFQFYIGPYFQIPLQNGLPIELSVVPGVNFSVAKQLRFFTEFNLNLSHSYGAASLGVKYFF
jgi:hypothetical protein